MAKPKLSTQQTDSNLRMFDAERVEQALVSIYLAHLSLQTVVNRIKSGAVRTLLDEASVLFRDAQEEAWAATGVKLRNRNPWDDFDFIEHTAEEIYPCLEVVK